MVAQDFSATFATHFAKQLTREFEADSVALGTVNRESEVSMKNGGISHQFGSVAKQATQAYESYTDVEIEGIVSTNETLTLTNKCVHSFKQGVIDTAVLMDNTFDRQKKDAKQQLMEDIDGDLFFEQATQSGIQVDDGNLQVPTNTGAGSPIILNSGIPFEIIGKIIAKQAREIGYQHANTYTVIDPIQQFYINDQIIATSGYKLGDEVLKNGYKGVYAGSMIFVSNNLTYRMSLTFAVIPVAGETVTVFMKSGQSGTGSTSAIFTFVAALTPGNPGEVLIGVDRDATILNMVDAIGQNSATLGITYSLAEGISAADTVEIQRRLPKSIASAYNAATGELTIYHKRGFVADPTSTTGATILPNVCLSLMGDWKQSMDFAMPKGFFSKVGVEPRQFTDNYLTMAHTGQLMRQINSRVSAVIEFEREA